MCYGPRHSATSLKGRRPWPSPPRTFPRPISFPFVARCFPFPTRPGSSISPAALASGRRRAGLHRRHGKGDRRGRHGGARRLRTDRLSRDHGRPRQDPASVGAWRAARRARRSRTRRGDARRMASSRSISSSSISTRSRRSAAPAPTYASIVENIDIGGPAMVRAVGQEPRLCRHRHRSGGLCLGAQRAGDEFRRLSLEFRKKLAAKAFARTAAYDAAISGWFAEALEIEHPTWRAFGGRLESVMRYGENPHQQAGFYVDRRQAAGRRHRAPASGQAAFLQQHQRHRRRLRTGRRVRSGPLRRRRHHQARQPVRRRRGRYAEGGLRQGARLRSGLGLRRHRRDQPDARRRGRRRDRQDLHRGHHRAGRQRTKRRRSSPPRRICACSSPAACPTRARPARP